jgi:hypothetical protein
MTNYNFFNLPELLQERIMPEPMSGCWLWIAAQDENGYGRIGKEKWGERLAHRLVANLLRSVVPPHLMLCHHCDTPPCVNPSHTFEGTALDNVRDCIKKGRDIRRFGEDVWEAKLTEQDVIEIRKSDDSVEILASKYGVDGSTITHARTGRNWKHLNTAAPPRKFFVAITEQQKRIILADNRPIVAIARELNVSYQAIWKIKLDAGHIVAKKRLSYEERCSILEYKGRMSSRKLGKIFNVSPGYVKGIWCYGPSQSRQK